MGRGHHDGTMRRRRWDQWALVAVLFLQPRGSYCLVEPRTKSVRRPCRRHLFDAQTSGRLLVLPRTRWLYSTTVTDLEAPTVKIDDRPHEQRAMRSRTARRLNQSFRYLYRHESDDNHTDIANMTSLEFLVKHGGYSTAQVLEMSETFPPLLTLNVQRHLWPKLRFLKKTIGLHAFSHIPAFYFGTRLERIIAPRHALLVHFNLPHGKQLTPKQWNDFLLSCRHTNQFGALCNTWKTPQQARITAKQVEAFDVLFQRGLMAAARDELCQPHNTWPLQHINITSGEMISLLIQHGANPAETDARGVSLLHWAAGCGNMGGVQALLPHFPDGALVEAERDGATPLHWAVAGTKSREFGCGGHFHVCHYFFDQLNTKGKRQLVDKVTKDGNSALMWAAWSGTLDVVKLLIRNRADPTVANRNGCTVAHWAASGGNLEVCHYLAETVGVDFTEPNHGGNTPLTHAVTFRRADVVEWLRKDICLDEDDTIAAELAKDFVGWTDGDPKRKEVLNLFQDWFGNDEQDRVDSTDGAIDEDDDIECTC